MSRGTVVAILPAYNLEAGIGGIVARAKPFVDHVIVVCDGSKDGTAQAARAAGAIVPEPEAVRGKGFAVIKGIRASRDLKPSVIVLMDSDGQHLPEELPVVLAPMQTDSCDMVVGSRMLGTLRTSLVNRVGNFGLKLLSFAVTWRWMTDTESGFRAFRADKLYGLHLTSRGYELEGELLLKALHKGYRVVEVPITVPFAVPGVTVTDGLRMGWYKARTGVRLKLGRENA